MKVLLNTLIISSLAVFTVAGQSLNKPVVEFSLLKLSPNRNFVFVIRGERNTEDIRKAAVASWKSVGMSVSERRELESSLDAQIREEIRTRALYPVTGLYIAGIRPALKYEVRDLRSEIDHIVVSDSGEFVVGINRFVLNTQIERYVPKGGFTTDELGLVIYGANGKMVCSKRLSELIANQEKFQITSEGYYWLDEAIDTVGQDPIVIKAVRKDGNPWNFSINHCGNLEAQDGDTVEAAKPASHACSGFLALLLLVAVNRYFVC